MKNYVRAKVALLFALLFVIVATADAARWIVPAGAHAVGSEGTNWRTDLRLVNPTGEPVETTVYLLKAGRDNSALADEVDVGIAAGRQSVLGDVFFTEFGFDGTGALLVECPEGDLVVTSRTYNQVVGGTYGQFIPAVPTDEALQPGEEGHVLYLIKNSSYRTNLGFAAASAQSGSVRVQLYHGDGSLGGQQSFSFKSFGQRQINDIFGALGVGGTTGSRIVVTTDAPVVVYASVVDENTGDPVAVMAVQLQKAAKKQVVAAAARANGAAGSVWRTDLRIFNPGSENALVEFTYRKKGRSGAGLATTTVSVAPGNFDAYDDVMMSLFGLASANGSIWVDSSEPVMIFTRTYNQGAEGTFGQAIPGTSLDPSGFAGVDYLVHSGLSNVGFRSNVGVLNVSDESVHVTVSIYGEGLSKSGHEVEMDLGPFEMNQVDDILQEVGADPGFFGSAVVSAAAPVVTYVSVVDNASNDPVYEPGSARAGTFGSNSGGGGGGGGGGGDGECITLDFPAAGTVGTYRYSSEVDGELHEFSGTATYVSATATESIVINRQEMSIGGFTTQTESEVHEFHRILGSPQGHMELDRVETHIETSVAGFVTDEDVVSTFSPAQYVGPAARVCQGETWTTPSVTETTESSSYGTTTESTIPYNGVIESVDDSLTVEAGTFTCVRRRTTETSGDAVGWYSINWIDRARSVLVKFEIYDSQGVLRGESELVDLE